MSSFDPDHELARLTMLEVLRRRRVADRVAADLTAAFQPSASCPKAAGRAVYASSTLGEQVAATRAGLAALKAEMGCTTQARSAREYLTCRRTP